MTEPLWITTQIIGWIASPGDEYHRPICINPPHESLADTTFVQDGDRWVCIGVQFYETWDEVEEAMRGEFDKKIAEIRKKLDDAVNE